MTIESEIRDIATSVITPQVSGALARVDSVQQTLLEVVSGQAQILASQKALLDAVRALTSSPPADAPAPVPTPAPEPVDPPAGYPPVVNPPADPVGSVRWRGALWTISAEGKILRDGVVTAETMLTAGVVRIWVGADGLLWQANAGGERYRWTGLANWERMPPDVTITARGTIAAA